MPHLTPHPLTPITPGQRTSPGIGRLLPPEDVARRLSVSRSMVYKLIRTGELSAVYIGRLPRIGEDELARYVEGHRATREVGL